MDNRIPQSVTKRVPIKAYSSTDHVTAATSKTISVVISKNMAAFSNPSAGATTATELSNGWYYVDLSTTDTGTLGPLIIRGTGTGIDDIEIVYCVVKATNGGWSALPDAAAGAASGLVVAGSANVYDSTALEKVWDTVRSSHTTVGTFGGDAVTAPTNFNLLSIDGAGKIALQSAEHTAIAADVLNATAATYNTTNTIGAKINSAGAAADPWAINLPGSYSAGTAGYIVGTNLNATVASRLAATGIPTNFSSLSISAGGAVTVGTNNDKTGYTTTQTFPTNFSALAITAGGAVTVGTNNDKGGYSLSGSVTVGGYDSGQDPGTSVWGFTPTESYSSLHSAPTATQLMFELRSMLHGKSATGSTLSTYKVDGSTVAMTFTLNSSTAPTSMQRAS